MTPRYIVFQGGTGVQEPGASPRAEGEVKLDAMDEAKLAEVTFRLLTAMRLGWQDAIHGPKPGKEWNASTGGYIHRSPEAEAWHAGYLLGLEIKEVGR